MVSEKKKYSGKFILRLNPALHKELHLKAEQQGLSLNKYCQKILENYHEAGAQKTFVEKIRELYKKELLGIVLFGSYARGTSEKNSDIDLLLFVSCEPSRELYKRFDKFLVVNGVVENYSPHFVKMKENADQAGSIIYEAALEGQILWDPKNHVASLFSYIKSDIASGGLQRKLSHGHPYWIRRERA